MGTPADDRGDTLSPTKVLRDRHGVNERTVLAGVTPAAAQAELDRVARYRVLGHLGRGGMGEVLEVWDDEVGRTVAAKLILGDKDAEAAAAAKFVREGQVTGQLEHPGIVPLYELGATGAGRLFFTMRKVRGRTLSSVLDALGRGEAVGELGIAAPGHGRRARAWYRAQARARLLEVFQKVCDAVAYAHSRGVIHRDLKPDNVMVGAFGEVYVMDWGLAKLTDTDGDPCRDQVALAPIAGSGEPLRTLDGTIAGTPAYMPPEQAEGRLADIDERSDTYALGAILYEILAGRPPYDGATPWTVLAQVTEGPPPPPSRHAPDVPWELDAAVMRAMAHERAERYATATGLRDDVSAYLGGGPPAPARPPPLAGAMKLLARHAAASAATAIVALVLGSVTVAWYLTPGVLRLRVSPVGATVRIASRELVATDAVLELVLPAGGHVLEVHAKDHHDAKCELVLGRGQSKELGVALAHHEGTLEAHAEPAGSEIEVDGVAYGSRLRKHSLPTGTHRLRAWSDGCFEVERSLDIAHDVTSDVYCWLDKGLVWRARSPAIKRGLSGVHVLFDLDGDGVGELAHEDLTHLFVRRATDGRELASIGLATNSAWQLRSYDLGGDLGRVLVTAAEDVTGLRVICLRPRDLAVDRWAVWQFEVPGEPRAWPRPWSGAICRVGDLDGDGVNELAASERDGTLWVLAGRTGRPLARPYHIGVRAYLPLGEVSGIHAVSADGQRLVYVGRSGDPADPALLDPRGAGAAGCIDLALGRDLWRRELADLRYGHVADGDGDGRFEVWLLGPDRWVALDSTTGDPVAAFDVPRPADSPTNLFVARGPAGTPPGVVLKYERGQLALVRARDGSLVWHEPDGPVYQGRTPDGAYLLGFADRLECREPDGRVAWRLPGKCDGVWITDGDGDGKADLYVGVAGRGLARVDPATGLVRWMLRLDTGVLAPVADLPDVDGDGEREIVLMRDADQLAVVRAPRVLWSRKPQKPLQAAPLVLDTDGDGALEVVQLGAWPETLAVFDGATGRRKAALHVEVPRNRAPAVVDWDGDGRPDLAFVDKLPSGSRVSVRRAHDLGALLVAPFAGRGEAYETPASADLDGDGAVDLVHVRWHDQAIVAFSHAGVELWRVDTAKANMGGASIADLDGDGRMDVVCASFDGRLRALRGRDGSALWTCDLGAGSGTPVTVADIDGDGHLEVLALTQAGRLWVVRGADGTPLWTSEAVGEGLGRPVVVPAPGGARILVAHGQGGIVAYDWPARRTAWRGLEGCWVTAAPVVVDLDGDGTREAMVVASRFASGRPAESFVAALDLETGQRLWRVVVSNEAAPVEGSPAIADLDGDGIGDVVVAVPDALVAVRGRTLAGLR